MLQYHYFSFLSGTIQYVNLFYEWLCMPCPACHKIKKNILKYFRPYFFARLQPETGIIWAEVALRLL